MRKLLHIYAAFFFVALGVLLALEPFLWGGSRAPDVVYGDEMNAPEGVILALVGAAVYRRNSRVKIFAAILAILNGIAGSMGFALAKPVAFLWVGIWTVVFVTMCYLPEKTSALTLRGTAQTG